MRRGLLAALLLFAVALLLPNVSGAPLTVNTNWPVGVVIPDGDPLGVADTRTFSVPITSISKVMVSLTLTGGFNGDLSAYLTHESGSVVLLNRVGRRAGSPRGYDDAGMNVTFDDEVTNQNVHVYRLALNGSHDTPLGGPLTGRWRSDGRTNDPTTVLDTDTPATDLSAFNGLNPNGAWSLFIIDWEPVDITWLVSWGLEVTGPVLPGIAQQPQNQTVTNCSTASFSVAATGTEPLSYQWRRDGLPLAGQTNTTLTLSNAQPADAGAYSVVVSNAAGVAVSAPATLTVVVPLTLVMPSDLTASVNESCLAFMPDVTEEEDLHVFNNCLHATVVSHVQAPPAGTPVGPGRHTITLRVTDSYGNSATGQVQFVVGDPGRFDWALQFGGTNAGPVIDWPTSGLGPDAGLSIILDPAGDIYVTGNFEGQAAFGGTNLQSAGGVDLFVAKLNSSGELLWVRREGGTNNDNPLRMAVDWQGNPWVCGFENGRGTADDSGTNFFMHKYSPAGELLLSAAAGTRDTVAYGVAVDSNDCAYVTGWFAQTLSFAPAGPTLVSTGDPPPAGRLRGQGPFGLRAGDYRATAEPGGGFGQQRGPHGRGHGCGATALLMDLRGQCPRRGHERDARHLRLSGIVLRRIRRDRFQRLRHRDQRTGAHRSLPLSHCQ